MKSPAFVPFCSFSGNSSPFVCGCSPLPHYASALFQARLANTSNITFRGIEFEALLVLLDKEGICASSGSACLADSDEPSHVIKAMKPDSTASRQMIRFSLDVSNSQKEIEQAVAAVQHCVRALEGSS